MSLTSIKHLINCIITNGSTPQVKILATCEGQVPTIFCFTNKACAFKSPAYVGPAKDFDNNWKQTNNASALDQLEKFMVCETFGFEIITE